MINRGWQDKNARVSMCTIYYRLPIRISIRTILHDGEFFSPSRDRYQYETSNIMQAQRYGSYIYL